MKKEVLISPVGILGFGLEGQSTYHFLIQIGIQNIIIFDRNPIRENLSHKVKIYTGSNYLEHLGQAKTLFRSAGIQPYLLQIQNWVRQGGQLTSQIEYFCISSIFFSYYWGNRFIG